MQKNTSVTLGAHFENFIARQVTEGRYGSASEAIRAGLRLLEERETRFAALRQALKEGEDSGPADYSLQGLLEELDSESTTLQLAQLRHEIQKGIDSGAATPLEMEAVKARGRERLAAQSQSATNGKGDQG